MCAGLVFFGVHISAQATTQHFTTKDFSHWLNAAYIAEASYKNQSAMKQSLMASGYRLQTYKQIKSYSIAYALAVNHTTKQQIIVIRGTANADNVIVDAAFMLVPDKLTGIDIHQGFLLVAKEIFLQVAPELKPGYKINTLGHSLGGAAAVIIAMMLDAEKYPVGEIITFGQPKVTNISGSRKYKHLNITRLVTPKDIVPLVPPFDPMDLMNLSIFWHQGTEVVLFHNRQYAVLRGINSMLRAGDFLNDVPDEKHVNHHYMTTYINHLKSKLHSTEEVPFVSDFKLSDWFDLSSQAKPLNR